MRKFRCGIIFYVGGRGAARAAVCGRFPAPPPSPSKLSESHFTLPPIPITSDLKGPEAVVLDTSQPGFLPGQGVCHGPPRRRPVLMGPDTVRQPSLLLSERADASDGNPQSLDPVPETLAQLGPGDSDQAGSSRRRFGLAAGSQRSFAQTQSEKRQRSARIGVSIHTNKATGLS